METEKKTKRVFVSGCYDMLHSGHVAFFKAASQYGDLYVGIGSDATIAELKHRKTGKVLVEVSPDFYRPTDVVNLWGDPSKAKRELGWNPQKTPFEQLVRLMVDADMAKVAVERAGERVRTNLAEYLEKGIVK